MGKSIVRIAAVTLGIAAVFSTLPVYCQYAQLDSLPTFVQRNLSGPRLGFTYVPGKGELVNEMRQNDLGPVLSQFGWHFEYQVVPEEEGPSFVVELVPLIAGVEYGIFIPSASLAMGIRFPSGFEFGLGPNVMAGRDEVHTSLIIALGKSYNYGGVSIPVNLACATSPKGNRFSIIFGYAIAKSVKHKGR
jgi:hypothetical protein